MGRRTWGRLTILAFALSPLAAFIACSSSSPANGVAAGAGDASSTRLGSSTDSGGGGGGGGDDDSATGSGGDATTGTPYDSGPVGTNDGGGGPVPPAPAAAAGFTTLVFDQGGDAGWSVDLGQTNDAGYAWYTSGGFYGASDASTSVDGGVLTVLSGSMASATRLGPPSLDAGYVGHAFGGGFYVEASLALTPGCPKSGIVSAFWGLPVEKSEYESHTDQWPGQPGGFVNYVELDFLEFHLSPNPPSATFYALDWYGEYANDTPSCVHKNGAMNFCNCANNDSCAYAPNNGADDLPDATDFSAFNVYGAFVVPSVPSTPDSGYTQGFFNGAKTPSHLTWDPYDAAIDPPPEHGQVFAVTDVEHFYLIANSSESCPMQMAYVRVWQRP